MTASSTFWKASGADTISQVSPSSRRSSAPASMRRRHQRVLVGLGLLDDDVALLVEHPGDAVLGAEVAAVLAEHVPDLADGAVLVVGQRLDDQRRAARTVAFVGDLLVRDAGQLAGAALDRALDVVGRHVDRLRLGHDGAQPRVTVDVTAAGASRDRQFLDDAREDLAALGVGRPLLVLDCVPLGMAGHGSESLEKRENAPENDRPCYHEGAGRQKVQEAPPERSLPPPSQHHPDVGAGIPRTALVVAEHRVDAEARGLEPAPHLRHGDGAEGQGEAWTVRARPRRSSYSWSKIVRPRRRS